MRETKVTVKIPRPLYRKIQQVVDDSGFNSPTDFIVYVLRDLMGDTYRRQGGSEPRDGPQGVLPDRARRHQEEAREPRLPVIRPPRPALDRLTPAAPEPMGLFDKFKKKPAPTPSPRPRLPPAPGHGPEAGPAGGEPLRDHHPRLVPLRRVHGGGDEDDREAVRRQGGEALHVRLVDRAVPLQPPHRPPPAHHAPERVRVGVLQGGLLQLQQAPRLEGHGHRLRRDGPLAVAPRLPPGQARLRHPRARLAAGAEPEDRHQPLVRLVPAHGQSQRHGGDAPDHEVRRAAPALLPAQRRGDALPLREAGRGLLHVAADQRRERRLQEDERPDRREGERRGRGEVQRGLPVLRPGQAGPAQGAPDRHRALPRRRLRAALRHGAEEHPHHRDRRPRRALRRGRLLRPRADHARQVLRGPLPRGG